MSFNQQEFPKLLMFNALLPRKIIISYQNYDIHNPFILLVSSVELISI